VCLCVFMSVYVCIFIRDAESEVWLGVGLAISLYLYIASDHLFGEVPASMYTAVLECTDNAAPSKSLANPEGLQPVIFCAVCRLQTLRRINGVAV